MKKILTIDDDHKVLLWLKKLIQINFPDLEVLTASSGEEGLEMAKNIPPEVVLVDIMMPGMDGYMVCRQLKENPGTAEIPVIFLSSVNATSKNRIKAMEAGGDAFLFKPVEKTELILLLKAMFKIRESHQAKKSEKERLKELIEKRTRELLKELRKRIKIEKKLRESERLYRFLIENENDLIIKFDAEKRLVFANSTYCTTFGIKKEDIAGQSFLPLIHEDDILHVKKSLESLRDFPHKTYHEERAKTVNGWKWFGWSVKAFTDEKGQITETIAAGRDIEHQKKAEEALKEKEARLQELNATKDKFFSIIAHDLKTPISGITGLSELIMEKAAEGDYLEIQKMSQLLNEASIHYFDLLNNLLEWSRMQSGRKTFAPVKMDLCDLGKKISALFSLKANEKNIELRMNCPEISLEADPDMIKTVLRNLISNALKFTSPGGTIELSVREQNDKILFSVKDNGIGISEDIQQKLFKLGEEVMQRGTRNEKGTGLGLILCRDFIVQHGGTIWVESQKGKGSVFSFSLPKTQAART